MRVTYEHNLHINDISDRCNGSDVIIWYNGSRGLKAKGVNFYKDFITKMLSREKGHLWLYDLSAWAAFSNPKANIRTVGSNMRLIEQMNIKGLSVLKSASIIGQTHDEYLETLAKDKRLFSESDHYKESGIKIGDIFGKDIFKSLSECDSSRCYSFFQYIEGLLIVDHLVKNGANDIVFVLPNDESKYYHEDSFSSNLEEFLLSQDIDVTDINVRFLLFKYGTDMHQRPYNDGRDNIKKISIDMLYHR